MAKSKHPRTVESSKETSSKALSMERKRLAKLPTSLEGEQVAAASGSGWTSIIRQGSLDVDNEEVNDDEVEAKRGKKDKSKKRKKEEEVDQPEEDQASPSKNTRRDKHAPDADDIEEQSVGRTSKNAKRAHKEKGPEPRQDTAPEPTTMTNSNSDGMNVGLDVHDEHDTDERESKRRKKDKKSRKLSMTTSPATGEAATGEELVHDEDSKAKKKALKKAKKERRRAEAAEAQAGRVFEDEQQQLEPGIAEEERGAEKQRKKEGKKKKGKAVEESLSQTSANKRETAGTSKASSTASDTQALLQKSVNAVASTSAAITNDAAGTAQVSKFARPQATAAAAAASAEPVPRKNADKASSKKDKATSEAQLDPPQSQKSGATQEPTSKQAAPPARARKKPEVAEDSSESDGDIDVESLIQSLMVAHPKPKAKVKPTTSEKAPKSTPTEEETRKAPKDKGKKNAVSNDVPEQDGEDKAPSIAAFQGMEPMEILRSKWLTPSQLELVKSAHPEFWYNSGRFSRTEEEQIRRAVNRYRSARGLTEAEMVTIISTPRNKKHADANIKELVQGNEGFWPEIAGSVERRSLLSIYNYVKRKYNPLARAGPWTAEEDAALRRGYQEHGSNWQQISDEVGRAAFDCQDRYQKQLSTKNERNTGSWNDDETERLRRAVAKHGSSSWAVVAKVVGQRTPAQCRTKWTGDIARPDAISQPEEHLSQPEHRSNLVHALKDLKVKDESEIQSWAFDDPVLKYHSAKALHDRWNRLLKQALKALNGQDDSKGYTYADKLEWLLNRYPKPGVYLNRRQWLKTPQGIAADSKMTKKKKKPRLAPSKASNLSQAFVDSSDDESGSSSEEEDEGEDKLDDD
ncbi:BQ2448_4152 [Microbotryum intermedium]|uniref:BQ2448_4152 protein n=1 Tax=Microbotryum intermedium TaxID=269621 RepID=A0A238FHF6_9BASI|nr:BQ2448_4152 [Microbotryum intermedium]